METTRRPLTARETRDLRRLSGRADELLNDAASTLLMFMIVYGVGALLLTWLSGPPRGVTLGVLVAIAASIALGACLSVRRGIGRQLARSRSLHTRDLAAGQAECTTFEVKDALRVEEAEDEGSAYYLKLADGRVLFLSGQYLYEYEESEAEDGQPIPARFPCRRFTLARGPESRLFLDLEVHGEPFPPSEELLPFTTEEHRAGIVPEDGAVLTLDFERLRTKRAG